MYGGTITQEQLAIAKPLANAWIITLEADKLGFLQRITDVQLQALKNYPDNDPLTSVAKYIVQLHSQLQVPVPLQHQAQQLDYFTSSDEQLGNELIRHGVSRDDRDIYLFLRSWSKDSPQEQQQKARQLNKEQIEALKNYPVTLKGQRARAEIIKAHEADEVRGYRLGQQVQPAAFGAQPHTFGAQPPPPPQPPPHAFGAQSHAFGAQPSIFGTQPPPPPQPPPQPFSVAQPHTFGAQPPPPPQPQPHTFDRSLVVLQPPVAKCGDGQNRGNNVCMNCVAQPFNPEAPIVTNFEFFGKKYAQTKVLGDGAYGKVIKYEVPHNLSAPAFAVKEFMGPHAKEEYNDEEYSAKTVISNINL